MRMVGAVSCVLTLLAGGVFVAAQSKHTPVDVAKLGPQVGDRVPDFRLVDQTGRVQTLRSIAGPKGTMLLFYRSADW